MNGQCSKGIVRQLGGTGKELEVLTVEKREELYSQLSLAAVELVTGYVSINTASIWDELTEAERKIRAGEATSVAITRGNTSFVLEPWPWIETVGVRRL